MRILITGITGFVGGHLAEALAGPHAVTGISRKPGHHAADLLDPASLDSALSLVRPEWIVHLAGFANTGASFKTPDACWRDNLTATLSLYDAVVRSGLRPRILFASTGLIYGDPDEPHRPCDEFTTLKPASPYAASKAAADLASFQYTRNPGLDIVRIRLFNQIGPRQSADYAVANFARQIAAIEAGKQEPRIETGDLSAQRDLTDIRDTVRAFPLLLEKGISGEAYNAGRGETFSMQSILDRLVAMSKVKVDVVQRADRKADTAITRADASKLKQTTGWEPRIGLDDTLAAILAWWRARRD
ncbi:MAG: GDP-mannose 4,6-dehydratase [Gemmataceae bacterium]